MITLEPETDLEAAIMADARWQRGAEWGQPRRAHPEGRIDAHIGEVLANIEREQPGREERAKLRLIALLHDTFKSEVDHSKPSIGGNHHASIARLFAERYVSDPDVLEIVELHDEAYNSWRSGRRNGDWKRAEARAQRLLERLGDRLPLFMAFYRADNASGDKDPEPMRWFDELAARSGTGS